jgi:hypothetical protein
MRHTRQWGIVAVAVLTIAAMTGSAWAAAPSAPSAPAAPSAPSAPAAPAAPSVGPAPSPAPPSPGLPVPAPSPSGKPLQLPQTVMVTILGIQATNEALPTISTELLPIANELRTSKYNSFRMAAREAQLTAVGGIAQVSMLEGYTLSVQPVKVTPEHVTMVLTWHQSAPDDAGRMQTHVLARITMQIPRGKYLLWGQWRLKEGALLGAVAVK